jgi:hypothetical protein
MPIYAWQLPSYPRLAFCSFHLPYTLESHFTIPSSTATLESRFTTPSLAATLSHKTTNLTTHSYSQKISPTVSMQKVDGGLTPKP